MTALLRPQPFATAAVDLDAIDLFGVLTDAGNTIRACGATIYLADRVNDHPVMSDQARRDARAAALSVIQQIDLYEARR